MSQFGRPEIRIVHLNAPTFRALASGDLSTANAHSPVPLTSRFAAPEHRTLWQMFGQRVEHDPAVLTWVTGAIWDEHRQLAVGWAGYHGLPSAGTVELGYDVDPAHRRRGYARAALEALLRRAAQEPDVHTARVAISPDNTPSYRLAAQYGFVEVGAQWNDADGVEIIYEVATA